LRVSRGEIGGDPDVVDPLPGNDSRMEQPEPQRAVRGRTSVAIVGWPQETNVLLAAALLERGTPAALLTPSEALALIGWGDVAVGRLDVLPTLDGVEPGLDVLDELEGRGVRVINSADALLNAHDKLRTAAALTRAGIPHPRTEHLPDVTGAVTLLPPLVVKPRFGSWGVDVFRCENAVELGWVLEEIQGRSWFRAHGAVVQALVPPVGRDLRVLVAAGLVVGAVERVAQPGEWRTNVSLGADRRPVVPPAAAGRLAVRAAAAIGADFVGVDLLPVGGGWTVLELNGAVEFDRTYGFPGEDPYTALASALALPRLELQTTVAR
jgi:RimK family alpha-L-glutamate ligase